MNPIEIEHHPDEQRLNELGVKQWPIWEKEVSVFPWHYDSTEICYLLEGEVVVTPQHGEPSRFGQGDLVTLRRGLSCTWDIRKAVNKHYSFR